VKLDQNESPYQLPGELQREMLSRFRQIELNRYNDGESSRLRGLFAARLGVGERNVCAGTGIDELLYYLMFAFVEPGETVVRATPSFGMYKICATLAQAKDVAIPLNPDFSLPERFIAAARESKLVFLCRPNNPTGNADPLETVERLARACPGLVCIDEAYAEFASDNCASLLKTCPNVVILRTLSKAFGAAAARVGFAAAGESVIAALDAVRLPWNMPAFSQAAAEVLLENAASFDGNVSRIKEERARLFAGLQKMGVAVFPSEANFLLMRVPRADAVFDGLLSRGVLVRPFSSPELAGCLRVTVGTREENEAFLDALKGCLK